MGNIQEKKYGCNFFNTTIACLFSLVSDKYSKKLFPSWGKGKIQFGKVAEST